MPIWTSHLPSGVTINFMLPSPLIAWWYFTSPYSRFAKVLMLCSWIMQRVSEKLNTSCSLTRPSLDSRAIWPMLNTTLWRIISSLVSERNSIPVVVRSTTLLSCISDQFTRPWYARKFSKQTFSPLKSYYDQHVCFLQKHSPSFVTTSDCQTGHLTFEVDHTKRQQQDRKQKLSPSPPPLLTTTAWPCLIRVSSNDVAGTHTELRGCCCAGGWNSEWERQLLVS